MDQLTMISDNAAERRMADRLARAGIPVVSCPPSALAQSEAGHLYLVTAERAAGARIDKVVAEGAHVCLIPPWPEGNSALAGQRVAVTPATHRDPIQLQAPLRKALGSAEELLRPLRILYREYLPGLAAGSLAQSSAGELVLASLPRLSNLHGVLVVTTLMLGHPSAQTDPGDVAILLRALHRWMSDQVVDQTAVSASGAVPPQPEPERDRDARLVLLALALALPELSQSTGVTGRLAVAPEVVRHHFEHLAVSLGTRAESRAFDSGWEWLRSAGVLVAGTGDSPLGSARAAAQVSALDAFEYLQRWQLNPRLRRLRSPAAVADVSTVEQERA